MRTLRRQPAAFTLLEVLIAIGILAIGMVTVFSLFPIALHSVKYTVDHSRGGALTESARAELAAGGAPAAILAAGARSYAGTHVPFGPWAFPADLSTFRAPLYEYIDTSAFPGILRNRVVFDERTMVPITLNGLFTGGFTVNFPGVGAGVVQNRDTDRLEYFYDVPGSTYAPWDIYLKVRGRKYKIVNRTYGGITATDLFTLDVDGGGPGLPNIGTTSVPFEILLPVAMKEPPVDVPLEAAGAVSLFVAAAPGPYTIVTESANIAANLVVGRWVSVAGDWYQVAAVTFNAAGMPTTFTITLSPGDPGPTPDTDGVSFRLPLPVVSFNSLTAGADSMPLQVLSGSGPQLTYLESGAWIEFVFDGATADFNPAVAVTLPVPDRTAVLNVINVNTDTTPFIMAGNFIRIDGHDYEIASVLMDLDTDGQADDFQLVGTVPTYGSARYFHIVLGYDPTAVTTQAPGVARFPVTRVTRGATGGPPVYGRPVMSFVVGRDANGNLPVDLWAAGAPDPFRTPVHVLPANRTSFSYQVVTEQKSPHGTFAIGNPNIAAPDPNLDYNIADTDPIPYAPAFDSTIMALNSTIFKFRTLPVPDATAPVFARDLAGTLAGNIGLTMMGVAPTFDATNISFHAYDENDFDVAVDVGTGTYTLATNRVDFTLPNTEAVFVAGDVLAGLQSRVFLQGPAGRSADVLVATVDPSLDWFTVIGGGGLWDGDLVTVYMQQVDGSRSRTLGRGNFVNGSDCVVSVYSDTAGSFAGIPGRGLPYSLTVPQRYHLAVGDYIQAPDGLWYAVKAIHDDPAGLDFIILDRPYRGATSAVPANGDYFRYVTPMPEAYNAQVVVFRNYRIQSLQDVNPAKDKAAAFGFDINGVRDSMRVRLAQPLPPNMKPGHYIRADGDANHPFGVVPPTDPGLMPDTIDGDWRWYMIDSIGPAGLGPGDVNYRMEVTLTTGYLGHIPTAQTWQPASVTGSVIRTFDTIIGAF